MFPMFSQANKVKLSLLHEVTSEKQMFFDTIQLDLRMTSLLSLCY